jgi:hypothetical protein
MIPDLQGSVLCEDVRMEASGANTIVGVVNFIGAPTLPFRLLKACVWTRWCSGKGIYLQETKIIAPDEETLIGQAKIKFELKDEDSHTTNVNVFSGLEFKEFGTCHVEILLDGNLKVRYPVNIIQMPHPPTNPNPELTQ